MLPHSSRRWILLTLAALALFFLYVFGLTRTGMLSADEPRYAAIGRSMAQTGDWITPRLWGQPWFEKPALLYWMTATGFKLGLDPDLAPRLPVVLVSLVFLAYYCVYLHRQYGEDVACYATLILATSVGWIAFSRVAVTDLPLAVCFATAMLLTLDTGPVSTITSGLFLGLAILAKGLVPLALFLPAIWYLRGKPLRVVSILGIGLLVATPWYLLVTLRNGRSFVDEFFVKHHFERFATGALQHERPFWFYLPVLLAAIFPWTPLLWVVFRRRLYTGERERFLLAWVLFGLIFFSVSRNKLPGYLLPLLPALAILLALGLENWRDARWPLAICAALLAVIPMVADALPQALAVGASRTNFHFRYWILPLGIGLAALTWWLEGRGHRAWALGTVGGSLTTLVAVVVWITYPVLDQSVSARGYWKSHLPDAENCTNNTSRSWRYGLDYYAQKVIPNCNPAP